ncbi:MAG: DUF4386 domain-containing protein [Anaerolineales bacterium]|nr:MAG: DUF4386 domain-containing protein [Anaerolineales bacterium]
MSEINFRKLTGFFFIIGAILVYIPYTLLVMNFDYPDILRLPTAEILTRFQAGGNSLIYTWLAIAWVGLPLLLGAIMLKRILERENSPFLETATTLGVIGFIVQVIGLLRWVFVVPVLTRLFTDPTTDAVTKTSVSAVFVAVHQYGGVVLGEHLGQFFTIIWMSLISGIIYRSKMFSKWVAWLGWFASAVYLLAQTELLATAIPSFPVIDWAGFYGSLLWLLWMLVLGVYLVKYQNTSHRIN